MSSSDFVQLLRESVITQAIITVMMGGVVTFMLISNRPVPSELWALNGLVIGFYFGGKVQAQAMQMARAARAQAEAAEHEAEGRKATRRRSED